jgi:ACS family hexuronate transporter-like MFS transporter
MGLRAALGFFESANYPAAAKAISEWFPARERSLAIGILLAGASFGAMVAPPLLSNAVEYLGWQEAFVFSGLIGVFWLWFWNRDYFSPERHPRISVLERDFIMRERAPEAPDSDRPAVLSLLRRRTVIGLLLARFFGDNILIFYTFWLPLYLSKERGLNLLEIGYFAWIPFLFTDLGSLAGGWIATRMMSAGVSLDATRKLMLLAAALLVPLSVLALQVESTLGAMLMIGVALFFNQFKAISISSLPSDLYPSRDVATIWGYLGAAGSLGAFLFSPAIGWAVDKVSFTPVFVAVAASPAVVLVIVLTFIPRIGSLPAGRSA